MKNDIDSILNSMFSGGRLKVGKSRAAEDAEAFLKSIHESGGALTDSIRAQSEELSAMAAEAETARKEMENLEKNLEGDGLAEKKAAQKAGDLEGPKLSEAFSQAEKAVASQVIGQEDFLKKLLLSFKRPLVMGTEEGKAASTIIISGRTGTGRHSALMSVTEELSSRGILENGTVITVDLALYGSGADGKLLIQDLFAALQSKAKVILFENYHKCHQSLLPMLCDLVLTGRIRLQSRYVAQKGILVDAGTALVPGAVSSLNCSGQYLVFLTTHHQGKIADTMGAPFINGVGDICVTGEFTREGLLAIGAKELRELCARAERMLGFRLSFGEEVQEFFAGKFTLSDGVNSISAYSDRCYRTLSEYKLSEDPETAEGILRVAGGKLAIAFGEKVLEVPEGDAGASTEALRDVKEQLEEIVGLTQVKDYIFSLEEHYKVLALRRQKGLKTDATSMHMIFTGNPGTGKTTVARLVSRYLKAIGVLSGGQLIEVTRADLVGRFVGHTAPLTSQVIESALGGVLFIDEAYSLYRGADDSFGLEAIDTLVKGMEDNRDNLIVILAGYSAEMAEFLKANSGLSSRFPNIIEFPDYSAGELLVIARLTVRDKGYRLSEECEEPLLRYFERKQAEGSRVSGNGRMVRNLIEDAILNQSKRIIAEKSGDLEELKLLDFELQ